LYELAGQQGEDEYEDEEDDKNKPIKYDRFSDD